MDAIPICSFGSERRDDGSNTFNIYHRLIPSIIFTRDKGTLTTKSKFLYYLPVVAKSWKRKYIFGNVEESELRWFSWNSRFMR